MYLISNIIINLLISADPHRGEAARVPRVQGDLHAEGDAQRTHEEARRDLSWANSRKPGPNTGRHWSSR